MPKMIHLGDFLKTVSFRSNSVTRQVSFPKNGGNDKIEKFICDILSNFQTIWTDICREKSRHPNGV